MPHGKLTVIVENAVGIKDRSKHGRGDSYCTLQCGSQALSTHVAEGAGSHPTFHTEFKFEIDRSTNDLVISVYCTGSGGDDELVGYTTLDFKTIFFHGLAVPLTAYPLLRRSGRAGGHISISLNFKAQRPPPSAHNPHAPMRQHSGSVPHAHPQPTAARNQQHNYETSYEDGYGSSGSSESSRSSGKRSGDRAYSPLYRRSQSQPEEYYEDHGSDSYEYQAGASSFENSVHLHPRQPAQAQPRYPHASPSAHQAIPNVPHRAIPVKRGIPRPPQPAVQVAWQPVRRPHPAHRVQYLQQQGMQFQQQQGMQYHHQQQQQQQHHHHHQGVMADVAHAVAVEVAKESVQAVFGGLFNNQ